LEEPFLVSSRFETNQSKENEKRNVKLSESPSSLATIRAICEKEGAVKILRCLDRLGEPLKPSEIEKLTSVSYDKILSVGIRLSEMGVLNLHRTAFDKRRIFFSVKDPDIVKAIFQYDDKLTDKRKTELGQNGVEEV
jgi:hypothetical protein